MTSSPLFVIGRIRALESGMMTGAHLERMVQAPALHDAYRVLLELDYAQSVRSEDTDADFPRILTRGLHRAKNLVTDEGRMASLLEVLWFKSDVANLKTALRLFVAGADSEVFAEQEFDEFGVHSREEIQAVVWKDMPLGTPFLDAAVESLLSNPSQSLDQVLDTAYVGYLGAVASKRKEDAFIRLFSRWEIDKLMLRLVTRFLTTLSRDFSAEDYMAGGTFSLEQLQACSQFTDLITLVRDTEFDGMYDGLSDLAVLEQVEAFEKRLTMAYINFLKEAEMGEVDSIQIPLAYFERRRHNANLLRFVLMAHQARVSQDRMRAYLSGYTVA